MTDQDDQGPLGSRELERDRAGRDEALEDRLVRDETDEAAHRDDDDAPARPNPIAGTILPPD